jgi:hypothetical protein
MELAREAGIKAVEDKWKEKRANAIALKKEGAKKITKMERKLERDLKKKQVNKAEIKKNIFIKAKIKKRKIAEKHHADAVKQKKEMEEKLEK